MTRPFTKGVESFFWVTNLFDSVSSFLTCVVRVVTALLALCVAAVLEGIIAFQILRM